jgi:hypothetical protein
MDILRREIARINNQVSLQSEIIWRTHERFIAYVPVVLILTWYNRVLYQEPILCQLMKVSLLFEGRHFITVFEAH